MRKQELLSTAKVPKRQYKYLYKKMLEDSTIRQAWKNLRKGKTKRKAVIKIENNFENAVKRMYDMILNTKPCEVEHPELAYSPPKVRKTKIVHETTKQRTAYLADIWEQWYFHIIVEVLKPIIMPRLEKGVCGCIPGRGMHFGKKIVEKAIRKGKYVRYFFKCDIRHFYANIRIKYVIQQMRTLIADELFLYCISVIYKYQKKGILIGLYISPWISNFLLMDLDKTLKDNGLLAIRYVDDIVVFANSKKVLHEASVLIRQILGGLRLKLKHTFQVCKFDYITNKTKIIKGKEVNIRIGRPLDFLGFLFFRDKTVLRKHILLNIVRTAKRIYKAKIQGKRIYNKLARSFVSRLGWFRHTDTYYIYLDKIKPYVKVRYIKKIISKLDKEANKNDKRLENRALCYEA